MSGKKIASGMNVKDKYTFESVVADLFRGNLTRSYWGRASARARCKIRDYFTRPGRIDERGTLVMDHEANIMRAWSKEGGSYVRIQRGREREPNERSTRLDATRDGHRSKCKLVIDNLATSTLGTANVHADVDQPALTVRDVECGLYIRRTYPEYTLVWFAFAIYDDDHIRMTVSRWRFPQRSHELRCE